MIATTNRFDVSAALRISALLLAPARRATIAPLATCAPWLAVARCSSLVDRCSSLVARCSTAGRGAPGLPGRPLARCKANRALRRREGHGPKRLGRWAQRAESRLLASGPVGLPAPTAAQSAKAGGLRAPNRASWCLGRWVVAPESRLLASGPVGGPSGFRAPSGPSMIPLSLGASATAGQHGPSRPDGDSPRARGRYTHSAIL